MGVSRKFPNVPYPGFGSSVAPILKLRRPPIPLMAHSLRLWDLVHYLGSNVSLPPTSPSPKQPTLPCRGVTDPKLLPSGLFRAILRYATSWDPAIFPPSGASVCETHNELSAEMYHYLQHHHWIYALRRNFSFPFQKTSLGTSASTCLEPGHHFLHLLLLNWGRFIPFPPICLQIGARTTIDRGLE